MTLCPVALVAGCTKCPAVSFCPLKEVIGDYRKPDDAQPKQREPNGSGDAKRDR